jgi:hypothetical protein
MISKLKTINELDREAEQARELAAQYTAVLNERDTAARSVAWLEDALSKPDESTVALTTILEAVGNVDARFTTHGSGNGIGTPGGLIVAQVIRQIAGGALTESTRIRASFETRLPEARKRLEEAVASMTRFLAAHSTES